MVVPHSLGERYNKRHGLSSLLYLKCQKKNCNYLHEFYTSIDKNNKKGFDINKRIIYCMRLLGHGYAGIKKFCTFMNLPKLMTKNNFEKLLKIIATAVNTVAEQTMINTANKLRKTSLAPTDICASCDGTWHKRGYSSLNGVFSVIFTVSGKVLDEVMSRYCKGCSINQGLHKSNPNAYAQWRNSHVCKYNYQGSAGGMEPEGAKRVFQRSIDNRQLRYIQYLGDGDSKSYMNVKNTYLNTEIEKLECVGHYQKRVGTRLRNIKRKREKGLGGKGCLTDATIDRLQNFVAVAIRRNAGNLKEMKAGVLASLFHVASSKNNSLHFPHCPTGSESWCKYNADKINKTTTYKSGPGLPMDVIMKVRYIFEELSKDSELKKCWHGKTQNANESFNRMI